MATIFTIAESEARSGWIPITMTTHDTVVLVRLPRPSTDTGSEVQHSPIASSVSTRLAASEAECDDDDLITREDAEWR